MAENAVLDAIRTRRSVRSFEKKRIPDDIFSEIIDAGRYAPSAMNRQPCRFFAIQDEKTMAELSSLAAKAAGKAGWEPYYGAPAAVLVFMEDTAAVPVCDGSLAIGNMLLAAHSLGVSSCWIHAVNTVWQTEEGKAFFRRIGVDTEHMTPVGSAAFGYGKEPDTPLVRRENNVTRIG